MSAGSSLEYWLRGPIDKVPALLQPVAHALLQAGKEVGDTVIDFPEELLWQQPAGAASVGFHLQHMAGVLDRLFTYARGQQLNEEQLNYLKTEGKQDSSIDTTYLVTHFNQQITKAIDQLITTDENSLAEARGVGRKQIPSTVMGLLFHSAEHTMRHTGQLLVTVRFIKASK